MVSRCIPHHGECLSGVVGKVVGAWNKVSPQTTAESKVVRRMQKRFWCQVFWRASMTVSGSCMRLIMRFAISHGDEGAQQGHYLQKMFSRSVSFTKVHYVSEWGVVCSEITFFFSDFAVAFPEPDGRLRVNPDPGRLEKYHPHFNSMTVQCAEVCIILVVIWRCYLIQSTKWTCRGLGP